MGKQVNFYMDKSDEDEFVAFLLSNRDIVLVGHAGPTSEPVLLDVLPGRDVPGWFMLWLWNRGTSPKPFCHSVPEQRHYVVDGLRSEVVELSRSHLSDDGLVRGRMWAEMGYWDLGQSPPVQISKSEGFRKWYDRLARWIKRKGRKNTLGEYVLPGAADYEASGGKLCRIHLAPDVKRIRH